MKTNRYFAIAVVAVLVPAAIWLVAEAGVKSEPLVKNNESVKQNAEGLYITPEDYENLIRIVKKSRYVRTVKNKIDILKGLEAIHVLVENLTPEVERLGLTRQALQTDVELLLHKYGIETTKSPLSHVLYIKVSVLPNDLGFVAFSISVDLTDLVIPVRNPTITIVDARVWHNGSVGSVGKNRIRSIHENVKDVVEIFINDYLAANPRVGE